ncbi:MAG: hypothetical protein ACO39X_05760 [Candidatus Nanopelagicaceae bacterium]
MDEILAHLTKLEDRLVRIENALVGDREMGVPGMVKRLDDVENKVAIFERRMNKIFWICVGAGTGSAGIAQVVGELLSRIG